MSRLQADGRGPATPNGTGSSSAMESELAGPRRRSLLLDPVLRAGRLRLSSLGVVPFDRSKDARGETKLRLPGKTLRCKETQCVTLRTTAILQLVLDSNAPCDEALGQELSGRFEVDDPATAYEKDGLGRGVHAGNFVWTSTKGVVVQGKMSGITNAGLVRAKPFAPGVEKCVSEGILVGRLCGQVVKTEDPKLRGASVVATYRLKAIASPTGENGQAFGTIEGVVVVPC